MEVSVERPFLSNHQLLVDSTKIPVICSGVRGTLCVVRDGSVFFHADEKVSTRGCRLACCGGQEPQVQVRASDLVGATLEADSALRVWSCSLDSSHTAQPDRRLHKSALLQCESAAAAEKAVALLQAQAAPSQRKGGASSQRRALVIINPRSGQGLAARVFRRTVEPMLAAAGFRLTAYETRRRGHATEIVAAESLGSYEAVVAVGGDGTVFEILQGYFQRPDYRDAVKTPFVLVPSGSGNALAANSGLFCAEAAALAVVRGRTRTLDVFSVLQPSQGARLYGFLSVYFGMMANLDRGTEHLRWLGSLRFTLGALHQIWQGRRYAARVAFLPAEAAAAAVDPSKPATGNSDAAALNRGMHAPAPDDSPYRPPPQRQQQERAAGAELLGERGRGPAQHAGMAAAQHAKSGNTLSELCRPGPPTPLLDALGADVDLDALPATHPGWRLVPHEETAFFAAVNLPLLSFTSLTGPRAGHDTGCLDVMYVPMLASRGEGLDFLSALERGQHIGLDAVRLEKAAALIVEPLSEGTWLMVDGEDIPYERIYVEVHPGLCSVIVA